MTRQLKMFTLTGQDGCWFAISTMYYVLSYFLVLLQTLHVNSQPGACIPMSYMQSKAHTSQPAAYTLLLATTHGSAQLSRLDSRISRLLELPSGGRGGTAKGGPEWEGGGGGGDQNGRVGRGGKSKTACVTCTAISK